jgi:Tfp pilus assembly protein PilO
MGLQEDFKELAPSKCFMGGILLAAAYYFMMFDSGEQLIQQADTIKNEMAQTKERLGAVQNALEDKASFESRAAAITKELEELLKFFPEDVNINKFQQDISAILQKNKNLLIKMQEEKVDNRFPGYLEQGIKLESQGGFHEVMDFLAALTQVPRMVDIKSLKFSSSGSTDEMSLVKVELILTVFSYDPSLDVSPAASPAAPTPPPGGGA